MVKKAKPPTPPPARSRRGRNEFGDPKDTLYTGGTPLFDERTGKSLPKRPPARKK